MATKEDKKQDAAPPAAPDYSKMHLYQKMVEAMKLIGAVEKSGVNEFHRYKYVTEADVMSKVHEALCTVGVMIMPSVSSIENLDPLHREGASFDKLPGVVTRVAMAYTFLNADMPDQTYTIHWFGDGQDGGDKGLYKALTGAHKSMAMKTFQIASNDDAEADARTDESAEGATVQEIAARLAQGKGMQAPKLDYQSKPSPSKYPPKTLTSDSIMPFGKWKGKQLGDIPLNYFEWLMGQPGASQKYSDFVPYLKLRQSTKAAPSQAAFDADEPPPFDSAAADAIAAEQEELNI